MSGGSMNYLYRRLIDAAENDGGDFVEGFNKNTGLRRQFALHMLDVADALKAIEWNDSGDGADNEDELISHCLNYNISFLRQKGGPLAKEWDELKNYAFYTSVDFAELCQYLKPLSKAVIPIGSVEFVEKYCELAEIRLPPNYSYGTYPGQLDSFLRRSIRRGYIYTAMDHEFTKPVKLKLFTGDIKVNLKKEDITRQDMQVWISNPVKFTAEYRFYIYASEIIGWCRYDAHDEEYPSPDQRLVKAIIKKIQQGIDVPIAYAIDIGYREDLGGYSLVEMNDFWSLGWYTFKNKESRSISSLQYARCVIARWKQIIGQERS
jgi:hypothetical protein